MKTVSEFAQLAVTRGHVRHTRVRAFSANGVPGPYIPVTSGEVSFSNEGTSGARAGRFSVPGYQWAPVAYTAPLAPFGQWVTVEIGIELDSGTTEWFALGQFPIYAVEVTRPGGTIEVTVGDWALRVDRAKFETAQAWPNGTNIIGLFQTLIGQALGSNPTVDRNDLGSAITINGLVVQPGDSRWATIVDIAARYGCYPVLTARNRLSVIERTETVGTPVEILRTGLGGTIIRSSTQVDALSGYNRFITIASNSEGEDSSSFRSVRTVSTGPFRYDPEGFGVMPWVRTESFPNANQALANTLSQRDYVAMRGVPRKWTVEAVPMPWLEVEDSIGLVGPEGGAVARIATVTFPFGADEPMNVETQDVSDVTFGPVKAYPALPYPSQTYPAVTA